MEKIPKLGRVISREQGVKNPKLHYVAVEWIDDEGYRVVGEFELIGWAAPPRAVGEQVMKILSKSPRYLYGPRGRAGS